MPVKKMRRIMEQTLNEVQSLILIYGKISDSLKKLQSDIKEIKNDIINIRSEVETTTDELSEKIDEKIDEYQVESLVDKKMFTINRQLNDLLNWYNNDRELKYKIL